jgi:hypothetical protein
MSFQCPTWPENGQGKIRQTNGSKRMASFAGWKSHKGAASISQASVHHSFAPIRLPKKQHEQREGPANEWPCPGVSLTPV